MPVPSSLARLAIRCMVRRQGKWFTSIFCTCVAADPKATLAFSMRTVSGMHWPSWMTCLTTCGLEPAEACTAEGAAKHPVARSKTLEVSRGWVSDTATHFKNQVLAQLSDALQIERRFAVACTPWSNDAYEGMAREVVRALRSTLSEPCRHVSARSNVLPPSSGLWKPRFVNVSWHCLP